MNRDSAGALALFVVVAGIWLLTGHQGAGQDGSSQQKSETGQIAGQEQKQTTDGATPRIELEEKFFDFGNVAQQTSVSHTFKVRNVGGAPLQLIKAKAG